MSHTFRVWAPEHDRVAVRLGSPGSPSADHDLTGVAGGWWQATVPDAGPGTDYAYLLGDDSTPYPDPRSRWQPHGVNGPSRVVDEAAFAWSDAGWRGVPLAGAVLYECHVGTFTAAGTFDAALVHLDHLLDLGVDVIELLPVNGFDGPHGWGYDGVHLWAVHDSYGGPEGLKRFVDAAHSRGLGVFLDVVYNHLGPSGNHLARFGPYFTDTHVTPWGQALNYDAPGSNEVRRWVLDNAAMWLREHHLDGLRLDAVHAVADERAVPLFEELGHEVRALEGLLRRPLTLVAESDLNDPKVIRPSALGGWGLDAQWCDDVHHALHWTLTGESDGYYGDFADLGVLAKALTRAFVHDGCWSSFRGRDHGRPLDTATTSGHRLVTYLQDHDQVGNRATGDRLPATVSPGLLEVGAALLLTSAFTPMLFMGEEWAASTPWPFFTSFGDPALAEAVRTGRRSEFAAHGWGPDDVPDPQDPATRDSAVLRWDEVGEGDHARLLGWYRRLIALRRGRPELTDGRLDLVQVAYDADERWLTSRRGLVVTVANLSSQRQAVPLPGIPLTVLLASAPGFVFTEGTLELDAESAAVIELAG